MWLDRAATFFNYGFALLEGCVSGGSSKTSTLFLPTVILLKGAEQDGLLALEGFSYKFDSDRPSESYAASH